MKKSQLFEIIKSVTIKEMARIPMLFNLSTTDQTELDNMLPDDLKKSSKVKEIISFYLENGNKPASVPEIVKHYGYAAQQVINTQFQRLREAGVLTNNGLAFPKQEKPIGNGIKGRSVADVETRSPEEKLKYIISKLKANQDPNESYKNWFIQDYSEENYEKLKELINNFQSTVTKDQALVAQNSIREFLGKLGFNFKKRGRKPGEIIQSNL